MSIDVEVALLHWPRDLEQRERLAAAMLPRLLLVEHGDGPPTAEDELEDWIRLPADERDVAARLQALAQRARTSVETAVVVDGRCLRRGSATVPLSPAEATFAGLLLGAPGAIVPRADVVAAVWAGARTADDGALDDLAYRLRRRLHPVGLDIVTARGRGFALHVLNPVHAGIVG